ncbi:MAG: MarR family transcriptional regulator [Alphaproteobacteria bacterium]|nr:MarR family transcriptional regulator [Alphaproteobacteria bacterium]
MRNDHVRASKDLDGELEMPRNRPIEFGILDEFVGFQLHKVRNFLASELYRMIAPDALPGDFPILYLIARNPGRTQTAISRAVGLDRSSLVPILNRLEREGWVNRSVSAEDKRAHSLVLTESGLTKLDELQAAVTSLEDRMSARIGGDGQMEMLKLLRLIQSVAEGG